MDSSADKRGMQSSGRKRQTTRHGEGPAPATRPVPGAFGREGLDHEAAGEPDTPTASGDGSDDEEDEEARASRER